MAVEGRLAWTTAIKPPRGSERERARLARRDVGHKANSLDRSGPVLRIAVRASSAVGKRRLSMIKPRVEPPATHGSRGCFARGGHTPKRSAPGGAPAANVLGLGWSPGPCRVRNVYRRENKSGAEDRQKRAIDG